MRIERLDPSSASRAYDILCQGVHPWNGVTSPPFAVTWCTVPPGGTARAHKHQEHEAFVVVRGRGRMRVDDEVAEVGPGDVIFMQPFEVHELANASAEEELLFLDLCWEVMEEAVAVERTAARAGGEQPRRVLATATPPTPNGDFHVGHLSGPYLAADVFTRYQRMQGRAAHFITGADDHQSYVPVKARQLGESARAVADRFSDRMQETLGRARIEVDHWALPKSSRRHRAFVERVFSDLFQRGAIVAREAPVLYCESCELTLFEAHLVGRCPHCGAGSNGNACEACGWPNDCPELLDPRCRHCGSEPVERSVERLFFPLAPYAERLAEWWSRTEMSPHLRFLCEQMLERGLPDIALSHPADWGIPVPVPGFEGQVIYVWFEMGPGYLAATQELLESEAEAGVAAEDEAWRSVWTGADAEVVQFFGFDNGYFHTLLFPATFVAWDPEIRLPDAFVTNEFYRYRGEKFSTSRGHAMWGRELLDRVSPDAARFHLAWTNPEREQTDFTFEALAATVRRELVGSEPGAGWNGWLASLGRRLSDELGGEAPGTGAWTAEHERFFATLDRLTGEARAAYEAATFSPQRAARVLAELVREASRFGAAEEPWSRLPGRFEERRTALALELLAAKTLALLAAPLLPDFATRLWRDLGFAGSPREAGWPHTPELVPAGTRIAGLDVPYFVLAERDSGAGQAADATAADATGADTTAADTTAATTAAAAG